MAHCDVCCLRVSPNKDKTLPRHYLEDTEGWVRYGLQNGVPGVGHHPVRGQPAVAGLLQPAAERAHVPVLRPQAAHAEPQRQVPQAQPAGRRDVPTVKVK